MTKQEHKNNIDFIPGDVDGGSLVDMRVVGAPNDVVVVAKAGLPTAAAAAANLQTSTGKYWKSIWKSMKMFFNPKSELIRTYLGRFYRNFP